MKRTMRHAWTGLAVLAVVVSLALPALGAPSKLLVYVSLVAVSEQSATAVPLDHEFGNGDRFRIAVRPSRAGHFYLLRKTKDGGTERIWPADGSSRPVRQDETVTVPEGGRLRLDPPAGRESLYLLFTASPLAKPETIVTSGNGKGRSKIRQIRLREVRFDDGPVKEAGTTFSADLDPQGVAVLEIEVRHR